MTTRRALVFALSIALAGAPAIARAQGAGDAKRAFEEAVETETRGEYEAALERCLGGRHEEVVTPGRMARYADRP